MTDKAAPTNLFTPAEEEAMGATQAAEKAGWNPEAPVRFIVKTGVINDETGQRGEMTTDFPALGLFPTRATMIEAFEDAKANLPEGFRLMTKKEWWQITAGDETAAVPSTSPGEDFKGV